jgi:D-alanyl-D-alanine carboxypeptidase/D-alanyl-D-alanine-endopeptidase (penicillin-binding protein 4)
MTHVSLFSLVRRLAPYAPWSVTSSTSAASATPAPAHFTRHRAAPPAARKSGPLRSVAALLACAALACAAAPAQARVKARNPSVNVSTVLPPAVMAGLARAHAPLSAISVVIEKVGDHTPIVALNAGKPMMPASTMKLVTTYSGLSILGPDYRWRTTAYADGNLDANGILHGNLYIQGTGDPKLVPWI